MDINLKKTGIFAGIIICLFIINLAQLSAWEFDNVKTYDSIERKVVVENSLGLGSDVAELRLITPLNVRVGAGYQKVAEFDFVYYLDDNGGLDKIETYQINKETKDLTLEKETRKIDYKIKTYEKIEVDDYETKCENKILKNGTKTQDCEEILIGSHFEKRVVWKNINEVEIKKGERYVVGLFTDVKKDDYVEWIPTFYGVEIPEWASWEESLNTDIELYFGLNETSSPSESEVGDYNLTWSAGVSSGEGIIGNGIYKTSGVGNLSSKTSPSITGDFTLSLWANRTDDPSEVNAVLFDIGNWQSNSGFGLWIGKNSSRYDLISWRINNNYNNYMENVSLNIGDGYTNLIFTWDGSDVKIYKNGVLYYQEDATGNNPAENTAYMQSFRRESSFGSDFYGGIDEIIVWSRALTDSEITDYYNGGDPPYINETDIPSDNPPISTLNSPSSANYTTIQDITINCTASDDINLTSVKLYQNDALNTTNSSGINNSDYIFDLGNVTDGDYRWFCRAEDNSSQTTDSSEVRIVIDTTPQINFTAPTLANNTNLTSNSIPVNVSLTETYFKNLTYYFYKGGVLNETKVFENSTRFYNKTGCVCDYWEVNATVCTTTNQCNSTETRIYTIDITKPIISTTTNLTNLTVHSLPTNSSWSYNASDTHLDSCYYNATNHATEVITCNSTIYTNWSSGQWKSLTYCANDTFGNEECNTSSIYINYVNVTQKEEKDPVGEGMQVTFELLVRLINAPTIDASFNFNGTYLDPNSTTTRQNYTRFYYYLDIKDGWGNSTGITYDWFWNYSIDGLISNKNTTSETITVYDLTIDDCTDYSDVILNISLLDEETGNFVNATAGTTIELDVDVTGIDDPTVTLQYFNKWTNNNSIQICMPSGLLNESQYEIDFTIGADSTDRVWEFFYLDDGILNSSKRFDTQTTSQINFYDLATADSTSFLFNYYDQDGLPVDDAIIHVFRRYIGEGEFKEVERARSDENGDTTVHLVEEDVIYYFMITQYGIQLYNSSTYTALCQTTPCTISLEKSGESAVFDTDWDLVDGGAYSVNSYPATRTVNLTYSTNSTRTFNLTVYQYESDGSYTALNTSSDTGTSGTILMTIPQSAGNVSFFATVHEDEEFIESRWVDFEWKAQDRFGITISLLISALIILTLGLMAVTEGIGTLVMVIFGVALSGFLGLMTTALSTGVNVVVYLVLAGAILIYKLTRGRK